MAENESHRERVKKLLAQDHEINDTQLKEFRMNLEASLMSWESKAARVRRGIMIAVVTYAASIVVMMLSGAGQNRLLNLAPNAAAARGWFATAYQFLMAGGIVAGWLSIIVGTWLLVTYLYRYAPALKRARFDAHSVMILELQQQVEQLRRELKDRNAN